MHAIGRIFYHGHIDNVQVSWVKIGTAGAAQLLQAGCNDLGGTLMDENISRAAGANHGQMMTEGRFGEIVAPMRRTLVQRNTAYKFLSPIAGA
jgi:FO synthase